MNVNAPTFTPGAAPLPAANTGTVAAAAAAPGAGAPNGAAADVMWSDVGITDETDSSHDWSQWGYADQVRLCTMPFASAVLYYPLVCTAAPQGNAGHSYSLLRECKHSHHEWIFLRADLQSCMSCAQHVIRAGACLRSIQRHISLPVSFGDTFQLLVGQAVWNDEYQQYGTWGFGNDGQYLWYPSQVCRSGVTTACIARPHV